MSEKLQIRLAQGFLLLLGIGTCSQIDLYGYVVIGKFLLALAIIFTTLISIAFLWTKSDEKAELAAIEEAKNRIRANE